MFNWNWSIAVRRCNPLRVILGCVLLSAGVWGQPTGVGAADAGPVDAGPASASSIADAGPVAPSGLSASSVPDAGPTVAASPGPFGAADAGAAVAASPDGPSSLPDAGPLNPAQVQVVLHGVPVTVTASSVLVDAKQPGRYGPAHLLDEDPGTVWAEGATGSGAGAWVELSFPPNTPVHAFLVTPGNPKSAKLYKANARPRKARLELKLAEGRRLDYELDFPRDFPAGGAIYVSYERQWAVRSARLTVVTVWPGTRYRDLCLGGFIPVFRGPEVRSLETFLGSGSELAPTLALFMSGPILMFKLFPPEASGVEARLRSYQQVPHNGPLPAPEEDFNLHHTNTGGGHYHRDLARHTAGAAVGNDLFRLLPEPDGRGYVFDPIRPPKKSDSFENFRVHWTRVEEMWRIVGVDVKYREQTADD